ncbi:hypothetical protein M9H77_18082 [Catharanthus roseus]|uniref:Uncharacterized protein n=1 Tax=Catharanthus roseus TaxID=4058 RepID=A0ACC0B6H4_CATRO|nr:hypothetical protein M9H77_18082 [Catharanthus roseus]
MLARALRSKYHPLCGFMDTSLNMRASYAWKSFWEARGLLMRGVRWRVEAILLNSSSRMVVWTVEELMALLLLRALYGNPRRRGVFWQFSAQMMGDAYRNSTTASEDKDADHVEMLARLLGIELAKRCRVNNVADSLARFGCSLKIPMFWLDVSTLDCIFSVILAVIPA